MFTVETDFCFAVDLLVSLHRYGCQSRPRKRVCKGDNG